MCAIKSMILLKDRVYCPANTDSHSKMLEELGIKDDKLVADFVKIEIMPPRGGIFSKLESWVYMIDQDNIPDWYVPELDEKRAREALKAWADKHVIIGKDNFEINAAEYYYLKDCKNVTACNSSTVEAYGSSTVEAYGSSTVKACDSSKVTAYDSSKVTAYDSSTVEAYDSSTVAACNSSIVEACDSSTVKACNSSIVEAYGSSTVKAYHSSTVKVYDSSTVKAYDSSTVITSCRSSAKIEQFIILDNSTLKDCRTKTIYQSGNWKFVKVGD